MKLAERSKAADEAEAALQLAQNKIAEGKRRCQLYVERHIVENSWREKQFVVELILERQRIDGAPECS